MATNTYFNMAITHGDMTFINYMIKLHDFGLYVL